MLVITKYRLLFKDWRGYLLAGFSLVWIANIYMNLYQLIRADVKKENMEASIKEEESKKPKQ